MTKRKFQKKFSENKKNMELKNHRRENTFSVHLIYKVI